MKSLKLLLLLACTPMSILAQGAPGAPKVPAQLAPDILAKIDAALPAAAPVHPTKPRKLLVFWKCEGFFHAHGIAGANAAIESFAKKTGAFEPTVTDDYSFLDPARLAEFEAVVLNNTTKLKLTPEQQAALLEFVRSGRGLVAIHAATDNFYDWPEGSEMLGGQFSGHPWKGNGTWAIKIDDPTHPLTQPFGGRGFKISDELYQFATPAYSRERVHVLLSVDMSDPTTRDVQGKKRQDDDYALAWIRNFGQGRVFHCGFGHWAPPFTDPALMSFFFTGLQYALGDLPLDATPSSPPKQ